MRVRVPWPLAVFVALALVSASALAQDIRVQVNGQIVTFAGTKPLRMGGRVMVPLRGVLEQMGAVVQWDAANRIVTATRADTELVLPVDSRVAQVNGKNVFLDVPAVTVGGSTMVPLRFVSEALGARVGWEGATNTVTIVSDVTEQDTGEARDVPAGNDPAPGAVHVSRILLDTGAVIPTRLDVALSSDQSQPGDRFTATVEDTEATGLPAGTRFEGVVTEAIPAAEGKPGVLAVDIRAISLPNAKSKPVSAGVISLTSKDISRSSTGRLTARAGSNKNEQWKWIGIGAGAGLLLSTVTKGNKLLDTLLGAGAGYLYSQLQRKGPSNVNLKAGTEVGIRLRRPFAYPAAGSA